MGRVGLALSGGGFRATLYHLGVIRYLRDAQILPDISHITTVSGGSILGAHLALNWDKYSGSAHEFDAAANEILQFIRLDIRNRIVRRFPLASTTNSLRRTLRLGHTRQFTRAGLLERQYERHLFGDVALSQLPDRPRLHILATNLSEGCLCSFNSNGLLLQRRSAGKRDRFERIDIGLATVPMAVAASSAFPGFFPPLELTGLEVGAEQGEFGTQAFTDGGVYDNLGLRMFRYIEQSQLQEIIPLRRGDLLELEDSVAAIISADQLPEQNPLHRLRKMVTSDYSRRNGGATPQSTEEWTDGLVHGLWEVIRSRRLYRHADFQNIELVDPEAESLLHYVRTTGRDPELNDGLWLNRQLVASALKQVVGKPCLREARDGFSAILVSDAGGKFKIGNGRAGGLIKTALRASDILMDRVQQLELETFENTPGVLFFPIGDVVEQSKDRWAPPREVQRQASNMRTDLDCFSNLEISTLVQHGYCVSRRACRDANLVDAEAPLGPPWDPIQPGNYQNGNANYPESRLQEGNSLQTARQLQKSAIRRTWSTLFSSDDWTTFVWVPILLIVALSLPLMIYRLNAQAQKQKTVLSAIAETSPVYRKLLTIVDETPDRPFVPAPFIDVDELPETDPTGYEVVSDTRIYDLRNWSGKTDSKIGPPAHVRIRIRRLAEAMENTILHMRGETEDGRPFIACQTESLKPVVSRMKQDNGSYLWDLALDFSHIPIGTDTEVVLDEIVVAELAEQTSDGGHFKFSIPIETGLVQIWMLMPEGRKYDYFQLTSYPIGQPELAKIVVPDTTVELPLGSIATFQIIKPPTNYRFECRWRWATK